ncbi:DUF1294 domain-containing protein [Rossellomorea marisflavi]|uniref:DUF1294 domain-containing protein n=1 Tax=Rossellomorea marisflavi TaxID=189381 RepID=UPI00325B3C5E
MDHRIESVSHRDQYRGLRPHGPRQGKGEAGEYRISERTLWQVAILGGSVGSYFGMRIHRHKTKHAAFRLGLPLLVILHGGLYIWFVL